MLWSEWERLGRFFDPWREFERTRRAFSRLSTPTTAEFPAMNVWVTGDHAVVTTEIPGIDLKSLDISVIDDSLTLKGSRKSEDLKEGECYHRRERWEGQFTKTFHLPFRIEAGKVEARFTKGVLYISLPRAEADKPKKISVKAE